MCGFKDEQIVKLNMITFRTKETINIDIRIIIFIFQITLTTPVIENCPLIFRQPSLLLLQRTVQCIYKYHKSKRNREIREAAKLLPILIY